MWQYGVFGDDFGGGLFSATIDGVRYQAMTSTHRGVMFMWPSDVGRPPAPEEDQRRIATWLAIPTPHEVDLDALVERLDEGAVHFVLAGQPFDRLLLHFPLAAIRDHFHLKQQVKIGWTDVEAKDRGGDKRAGLLLAIRGDGWALFLMSMYEPHRVLDLAAWLAVQ